MKRTALATAAAALLLAGCTADYVTDGMYPATHTLTVARLSLNGGDSVVLSAFADFATDDNPLPAGSVEINGVPLAFVEEGDGLYTIENSDSAMRGNGGWNVWHIQGRGDVPTFMDSIRSPSPATVVTSPAPDIALNRVGDFEVRWLNGPVIDSSVNVILMIEPDENSASGDRRLFSLGLDDGAATVHLPGGIPLTADTYKVSLIRKREAIVQVPGTSFYYALKVQDVDVVDGIRFE